MINVAVVIEVIFNWPGVGLLLYDGLTNRDFPMVQGVVLMSGVMIVLLNFMIDVLYGYVDPRVRLSLRRQPRWPPSLTMSAPIAAVPRRAWRPLRILRELPTIPLVILARPRLRRDLGAGHRAAQQARTGEARPRRNVWRSYGIGELSLRRQPAAVLGSRAAVFATPLGTDFLGRDVLAG